MCIALPLPHRELCEGGGIWRKVALARSPVEWEMGQSAESRIQIVPMYSDFQTGRQRRAAVAVSASDEKMEVKNA
jgi:hypothetical protein